MCLKATEGRAEGASEGKEAVEKTHPAKRKFRYGSHLCRE